MTRIGVTKERQRGVRGSAKRRRAAQLGSSNWWSGNLFPCLCLVVGTLALYGQVVSHGFIRLDDEGYVTQNPHVKAGLTWQTIRWSFTSTEQANWHPLTWLSHALDYQLFGLAAGGHHMTSVLFHVLNAVLLFLLLRRATGAAGRSFVVAALFAWHPFNVESVAWVAERKNVLSTFFFLLAIGAYGWYAQRPHWKRYIAVAALFVLGLAAKPMIVTLPFVLLLLDFWPLKRVRSWLPPSQAFPLPQQSPWHLALEKLPLLVLSAVSSRVTMIAQRGTIATTENLPFTLRLANALYSYFMYAWKMLWPSGFALYYPHPFAPIVNHAPEASVYAVVALGALLLVGASLAVWQQRFRHPYLVTGWLCYVGMLVPVIGIVQVGMQAMADRYAYVPLIGLFVIVVWGFADLANGLSMSPASSRLIAALVLAALWILTYRQVGYWRSGSEIWGHTLEVTQDNFVADDNMADALMSLGRPESIQYFQEAARIAPKDSVSHGAVAAYLEDQGRLQEAIPEYEVVLQNPPTAEFLAFAYANLGIIYTELGDFAKAGAEFQQALSTDRRAMDKMIDQFSRAAAARPGDEVYVRLGLLLEQEGRSPEARAAYLQALKLNPKRMEVQRYVDHLGASPS
ncbi:MAG TPA: tetratricopeptide repeat protein [Candidatus Sulfotelmatobacter sp.]|jgi:tetratricopeptide (TPR) repeat protein